MDGMRGASRGTGNMKVGQPVGPSQVLCTLNPQKSLGENATSRSGPFDEFVTNEQNQNKTKINITSISAGYPCLEVIHKK